MSVLDVLFGKKPEPPSVEIGGTVPRSSWEDWARRRREGARWSKGLWATLTGAPQPPARVCPVQGCRRPVAPESDTCPVGHYVG